ncbi:MAG: NAD(P)-dependent oxidoreductase, partial [Myxococcales bacterium]|nr:NAD(P)-dependent oxidoreductase [Myxococcales bacterium]
MLARERETLLRIAEAATPAGRVLPAPDDQLVGDVEHVLRAQFGKRGPALYRALLQALDMVAVPLSGQRTSALPLAERQALLARLNEGSTAAFWLLRSVTAPIKIARARTTVLREALAITQSAAARSQAERWQRQIIDARALDDDEQIEVDCVIVGSGAGGAPLAHALANRGHAVLILEAGAHFTRDDFAGDVLERQARMYRRRGAHFAIGNTPLLVPMGETVGGSTTINSGTCYRVPERVQRRWMLEEGLASLGPGSLDGHYERVERMLGVARATPDTLGGCAEVIARGAEALGYAHEPLMRNAPGCDGQGTCVFGCPTDAKRGTNVSYIPAALARGALLYSRARVERVLLEGDRAVGVVARARREDGSSARITVRAAAVALAAGAAGTPKILLANRLANSSGRVGHGLTLHPASYAWARFDHDIRGWSAVPQGYGVEEFADVGLRFEGAFLPLEAAAATLGHVGARWT